MPESASALSAWESFYVIVGSSGGALIGLQFVVITLIADKRTRTSAGALSAFGTPTVVHFSGALFVSALMSAPWHGLGALSVAIGITGFCGLAYCAVVVNRARLQTEYQPETSDWIWYALLPSVCYVALAVGGSLLYADFRSALFVIGASALSLLLIGIHNAWDTVTHLVITASAKRDV
jgi:hypothetical protein